MFFLFFSFFCSRRFASRHSWFAWPRSIDRPIVVLLHFLTFLVFFFCRRCVGWYGVWEFMFFYC